MFRSRRSILLIVSLLLTSRSLEPVLGEGGGGGNVGCLFNPELCELKEYCFDDNAFGRCVDMDEEEDDYYRHLLGSDTMQLLEEELIRLFSGGYRWRHDYTQCVVQNILYTKRHQVNYDPGLCSRILQMTSAPMPNDAEGKLLTIEPDELASIRFKPNKEAGNAMYADEIFVPPLVMEINEKRSSVAKKSLPQSSLVPEKFPEESDGDQSDDPKEEGDALFRYLIELVRGTRQLLDDYGDSSSRFPSKEINVIKTDLSSDMNYRPAFSEGGIEWVPLEKDNSMAKTKSRVIFPGEYSDEKADRDLESEREIDAAVFGASEPQHLTRSPPDDNQGQPPRNSKGRNTFEEDLDNWAFSESARDEEKNLALARKESEENDKFPDGSYNDASTNNHLPTFQRPMRYDIKKPGPSYFFHGDGSQEGEGEEVDDEMIDRDMVILQRLMEATREQQLQKLLQPPQTENKKLFAAATTAPGDSPGGIGESEMKRTVHSSHPQQLEVIENTRNSQQKLNVGDDGTADAARTGEGHLGRFDSVDATQAYIILKEEVDLQNGEKLILKLERMLELPRGSFSNIRLDGRQVTFKVNPNSKNLNASDVAAKAKELAPELQKATGFTIDTAGIGDKVKFEVVNQNNDRRLFVLTFVLCGGVVGVLIAVAVAYVIRRHARSKEKLQNITQPDTEASQDYQDLCRQRMANKTNEKPEPVHVVQSPKKMRSLSQGEGQVSSSSHSSTSSWNEEPVTSNMDISTGHMILSYMEDHLKNKDRLDREWEALCAYEAEPCSTNAASLPLNIKKNRYTGVLPYDHSRVILNELSNVSGSDYTNASTITDHDPRNPAYIATQGPLPHTAADFWQMIWEQGSVVIVMLTRLMENGVAMCHRYWPEEGSEVYHIYEVHLVSEHIWCDDYLVRSFYLKNLRTGETRTVTQFHFLSWPDNGVPNSTKALLEFRRKVNKSYRGRSCPIVVHCSDGTGRTGTYCLIDMVLNRMAKGAKEIDIAATLEHVRDQRGGMVKTKAQFEFVLMAIAEEVHAILRALSQ